MIKRYMTALMAMAILIGVISISLVSAQTSSTYTIDFEQGLNPGDIVSTLDCTHGITCPSGSPRGVIGVHAVNPDLGAVNAAMIFNADCVPKNNPQGLLATCTGDDDDLSFPGPEYHNTLIVSEHPDDPSQPDDADVPNSFIEFDFNDFPGTVTVDSIDVADIETPEDGAFVHFHDGNCTGHPLPVEGTVFLPVTGNNIIETVLIGISAAGPGVDCLHVHLNGSGTIDNIKFTVDATPAPDITIEKLTNGEDADTPTGPVVLVGSTVTFTYVVTNIGNEDMVNVSVTDDQGVVVDCPDTTLAVGELMTCTGTTKATAGQYANVGQACGDGAGTSQEVCDPDPSHHFGADPGIDIEKATNGNNVDGPDDPNDPGVPQVAVGGSITWTYAVANTGNVPFNRADVSVVDDAIGPVTGLVDKTKGDRDDLLEPGEVWIYEATGVAKDLGSAPAGVTIVDGCNPGGKPDRPTYENVGVVTVPGGATDEDLSHYCNPPGSAPALARITGGGWRVTGSEGEDIRSSGGFTLHCDITLSNNLQINWGKGQKWHINKVVDAAFCKDDPEYTPGPPTAPADTYFGLDVGKLNNQGRSVACFKLEDHGERANDPDGPDQALIRIWKVGFDPGISAEDLDDPGFDCTAGAEDDPTSDINTVLFVPESDIQGNFQFHEDQPHKNGNGQRNR